ncbi:MAG: transcriptional repressor [Opitutae bacterium]|nr:transcriptional repressor [Opitutae bacterium]
MKRNTKQGQVVLEVIRNAGRPLTPREVHKRASDRIPQLGIATTYRHLKSLTQSHQVVGVDYPGQPPRYEWADGEDKVHFACRSCEKLFALEDTT